jgi:hypothetical protein
MLAKQSLAFLIECTKCISCLCGGSHMMKFTDGRYYQCYQEWSLRKMEELGKRPYILLVFRRYKLWFKWYHVWLCWTESLYPHYYCINFKLDHMNMSQCAENTTSSPFQPFQLLEQLYTLSRGNECLSTRWMSNDNWIPSFVKTKYNKWH